MNQTDTAAHGGESLDAVQKANGQPREREDEPSSAQEAPAELRIHIRVM